MTFSQDDDPPLDIWPPPPSNTDLDAEDTSEDETAEDCRGVLNRFFVFDIVLGIFAGWALFIPAMLVIVLLVHSLHFAAAFPGMKHVFMLAMVDLGPLFLFVRYWRRYPNFMLTMIFTVLWLSVVVADVYFH